MTKQVMHDEATLLTTITMWNQLGTEVLDAVDPPIHERYKARTVDELREFLVARIGELRQQAQGSSK